MKRTSSTDFSTDNIISRASDQNYAMQSVYTIQKLMNLNFIRAEKQCWLQPPKAQFQYNLHASQGCIFHGAYPWYFLQDSNCYFMPHPQLCLISRDTQALLIALRTMQTQTLFIYSGYCFQAVVQDRQCSHPHHPHFPAQREHCRYACFRD